MTFPSHEDIEQVIDNEQKRSIQGILHTPFNGSLGIVDNVASNAGLLFTLGVAADTIPKWSIYPAARDRALRVFYRSEPILAGAVYSMSTRIKSLEWKLTGEDDLQPEVRAMFEAADFGNGLRVLIEKTITDLCTQDNGFFWELIGLGSPDSPLLGGVVQGVNYLDPAQCYRTFDMEYPVMYIDPFRGTRHKLHRSRVISGSSMPQPYELARGVGFSPVSRALLSAQLMRAIQQFRYEKASGTFARAIGYGTGMTQAQLRQLIYESQEDNADEGFVRFGKIPFYVSPRKDVTLNILDLASIPDGFDLMNETDIYVYTVALAFGVDSREFWPATGVGATKADASVQHLKSQGKGIADFITLIERAINRFIVPEGMTFEFDFTDDEQDRLIADRNKVIVDTMTAIKGAGAMDEMQLQAMLIHMDVLDADILKNAKDIAVPLTGESLGEDEDELIYTNPMAQPMNGNPPQAMPMNGQDPKAQPQDEEQEKALKTQEQYQRSLYAAIRSYWAGEITDTGLVSQMDSIIRRHYTRASYDAAKEAGLSVGDISPQESAELQSLIANEQDYVVGFVTWIAQYRTLKDAKITVAFDRIKMWAGRYERIKAKFLSLFAKNKKLMWKYGHTEHCQDCLNLNGRVYRGEIWDKYNLEPRSPLLACGGFRCQCKLVVAPQGVPVTKGKPPKLAGRRPRKRSLETGQNEGFLEDFKYLGKISPETLRNAGVQPIGGQ